MVFSRKNISKTIPEGLEDRERGEDKYDDDNIEVENEDGEDETKKKYAQPSMWTCMNDPGP